MSRDKQIKSTERDRLIELLKKANKKWFYTEDKADYLLANGVIVPPCKVGQEVYTEVLNEIAGFVVTNFEFSFTPGGWSCGVTASNGKYPMLFSFENVGKTVFLTREEAERALKGGDNNA